MFPLPKSPTLVVYIMHTALDSDDWGSGGLGGGGGGGGGNEAFQRDLINHADSPELDKDSTYKSQHDYIAALV